MKVIIPGGSGQVGIVLARAFSGGGHEVFVLSRKPEIAPWRVVAWGPRTPRRPPCPAKRRTRSAT